MYKQCLNKDSTINTNVILRIADNAVIPIDKANTDYQEYLKWVEAGNTPEAAS